MKRIYASLIILLSPLFALNLAAQQEIRVDSPEYFQAKNNGTLSQYTIVQDLSYQVSQGTATPSSRPTPKPKSGTDCDCYVAPDNTYLLALAPNDDGSSTVINLPFQFNFYGTNYSSLYINNNGNVTFGSP